MRVADSNKAYNQKRLQVQQGKQHSKKIKDAADDFEKKYEKIEKKHKKDISDVKKDFESKFDYEEKNLLKQLNRLRQSQKRRIQLETERVRKEIHGMKEAHNRQADELRRGQDGNIQKMHADHKEVLENANRKFDREMAKYQI
jgi:hypothetical protein